MEPWGDVISESVNLFDIAQKYADVMPVAELVATFRDCSKDPT